MIWRLLFLAVMFAPAVASAQTAGPFVGANDTGVIQFLDDTTTTCDAGTEGSIRYNDGANCIQLCDDGAWACVSSAGGGSCTPGAYMKTTSGADTFVVPSGCTEIIIEAWGGGGGGAGDGSGGNGGAGGNTVVNGTVNANGGGGGAINEGAGGAGGTASGGDINTTGSTGDVGVTLSGKGGDAANTLYTGGAGVYPTTNGNAGSAPGGGGAGGANDSTPGSGGGGGGYAKKTLTVTPAQNISVTVGAGGTAGTGTRTGGAGAAGKVIIYYGGAGGPTQAAGGSDRQVQYNSGGLLAGSNGLVYTTGGSLLLNGTLDVSSGGIIMDDSQTLTLGGNNTGLKGVWHLHSFTGGNQRFYADNDNSASSEGFEFYTDVAEGATSGWRMKIHDSALEIPSGTVAQRPASPVNGMIRYNTDSAPDIGFEIYENGNWRNMRGSGWSFGNYDIFVDIDNSAVEKFQIFGNVAEGSASGQVFVVEDTGNVGIGTTSPGFPLHVKTSGHSVFERSSTSTMGANTSTLVLYNPDTTANNFSQIGFHSNHTGGSRMTAATIQGVVTARTATTVTGELTFNVNNANASDFTTQVMRITNTGGVGIGDFGSDTIDSTLHIQSGDIRLDGGAGNQAGCIRFDDSTDKLRFSHDCTTFSDMGSGGGVLEHMLAGTSGAQTGVTTNTRIKFNTVSASSGSAVSLTTSGANEGQFTLEANKTYVLEGQVNISDPSSAWIDYQWYNVTAGAWVASSNTGSAASIDNGTSWNAPTTVKGIITTTQSTVVELRVTWAGSSTTVGGGVANTYAYIQVLGGNGGGGGFSTLASLSDVALTAPANGECLIYNGTTWADGNCGGGGTPAGADKQIQFNSGGAFGALSTFVVDSNGNVGIGTASPASEIHVYNSAASAKATIQSATGWAGLDLDSVATGDPYIDLKLGGVVKSSIYASRSDESFRITTNGADRMTIDSSGNVGIGTTGPTRKLHLTGNGPDLLLDNTGGAGFTNSIFFGESGTSLSEIRHVVDTDNFEFATGGSARLAITSSGDIGVGTTSPASALHVGAGDIRLDGGLGNQSGCLRFNDTTDKMQFSHDCSTFSDMGSGGATPGGSDTHVQFNDGGSALGGDAGMTYNKTTDTLSVNGAIALGLTTGAAAPVSLAAPRITAATVATSETRNATSYADITTVGPAVTSVTGTTAIVTVTAKMSNNTAGSGCKMGFAVSGATTVAASDAQAAWITSAAANAPFLISATFYVTGLTAGSNTFTAKYSTNTSGTCTFVNRNIIVVTP